MNKRQICQGVHWLGAIDWNRRLFDSLIPLPDGTSYNAYLIQGSEKVVLIDTVDPAKIKILKEQLVDVENIDYAVAQHAEQDHSGALPWLLQSYPQCKVLCSSKAKDLLLDHLEIDPQRILVVADGECLSLGDKTLQFHYTPWVHWPETMVTHLIEDRILFTCDFFGSHWATDNLYAGDDPRVCEAAKRYFAEIMLPFRKTIQGNLKKVRSLAFDYIAPSHGPVFDQPECILSSYETWASERLANKVLIPYISMHGSTEVMVNHLVSGLSQCGITVLPFELTTTDIGKLAIELVDATTIIIGTPTVNLGPHPQVSYAVNLANILRPKLKYAAIIGSFGWGSKVVDQISAMIPNLKVEVLGAVLCKGVPRETTFAELDGLIELIRQRHVDLFSE
jgi:flavorubredoxin